MAFFFPKIIHPHYDRRIYTLRNPDDSITVEPNQKKENRLAFNRNIGDLGYQIAAATDRTNDELLQDFNLTARLRPKGEVRERRVTCIRKLQRLINDKTLAYVKTLPGEIANPVVPTMRPSNFWPEKPLDERRFVHFKYRSQRPAWSNNLYNYVENNFVQQAYDELLLLVTDDDDEPPDDDDDEPQQEDDDDEPLRRSTRNRRPVERLFGDKPGGLVSRRQRLPPHVQAQFETVLGELTGQMQNLFTK